MQEMSSDFRQSYCGEKGAGLHYMELITRQRTLDFLVSASSSMVITYKLRPEYDPGVGEEHSRQRECDSQGPEQK